MLRLLRQISLPQLRSSWGRTCLVIGGIATGVTLIVAIDIINTSVLENFRRTIDLVAGPAQLEVTLGIGEVGFAESNLALVRADPDVEAALALVRGTVIVADGPPEPLELFGVDLTDESDLARYSIALSSARQHVLAGLADPHSILLTQRYASRHGLTVGESIDLSTPTGIATFTVRGLLADSGLASVFGGRLVVMDLPGAQLALGKPATVDQIDVIVRGGVQLDDVAQRLAAKLPAVLSVSRPELRGRAYERAISSFQAMLTGLSTLCLIAGIFIVYNASSTSAVRRAMSMTTMRLIGADTGRLFRLLMMEAGILGTIGAVLGLGQGLVLASLLREMVTESMGVIFQLRFPAESLHPDVTRLATVAAVGIAATMFASYFAARRVAQLDTLDALRADPAAVVQYRTSRIFVAWWVVLVGASGLALWLQIRLHSITWGNLGSTLWFASSIMIAIPLVTWIGSFLTRWMPKMFGIEGRIAAENLARSGPRTGVTVAAIALGITLAINVTTVAQSFRQSVNGYFTSGFLAADLIVSSVSTEGGWLETPVSDDVADEIAEIEGIHSVDLLRIIPGQTFRGERIAVAGMSAGLSEPSRHPSGWYHAGNPRDAHEGITSGRGARISRSLSENFDLRLGDMFTLDSPTGPVNLEVVGVVPDYMSDKGGVGLSRRLLVERWNDHLVNRINVIVDDGTSIEAVRETITTALGEKYRLKILSLEELAQYHETMINRAFAFTDAIQLLIVIVTIAGILDLLLSGISERRRELAVWRVNGADETMVRRTVMVEAATIGLLGAALGVAVGAATAWIWVGVNFRYLLGYYLEYHFATTSALWYFVLAIAMTVVAGYAAAAQAVRQSILEGIRVE